MYSSYILRTMGYTYILYSLVRMDSIEFVVPFVVH